MAQVNPAEVSAILKKQLSGFEATASLDEVGTVLTVGDGIARLYGLNNVQSGELVEFDSGLQGLRFVRFWVQERLDVADLAEMVLYLPLQIFDGLLSSVAHENSALSVG